MLKFQQSLPLVTYINELWRNGKMTTHKEETCLNTAEEHSCSHYTLLLTSLSAALDDPPAKAG
jgi:hypothetical protein